MRGYDDVAAILRRNEALRSGREQPAGAADQRDIDQQHHRRMPDHEIGHARVAVRQPVEDAIEKAGEPVPAPGDEVPLRRGPLVLVRHQDLRGQRRRQRQRTEAGDCSRHRDRDGEVLEEWSGNAAEERCRHEHRAQHQRDRDQRTANLLHGLERGVTPAHAVLEMPLDVFDHHDGVVNHDADRQHETEQRQIVDREAERRHYREGADQRHRDRDDRNDRGPPALQEDQHHDDDERHGLVDGLDQLMDGLCDELGRVVADVVVEPFREARLQLDHGVLDALGGRQRIRSGALRHQHRDRRLPQEEAVGGIVKRAELDPRHVAQPHDAAVLARLDDNVFELGQIL